MLRLFILFFFFLNILNIIIVPAEPAQLIDRIIAVVNGEIITQRQLVREMSLIRRDWGFQDEKKLRDIALERMINECILLQEAKREKITVSSQEVEEVLSNIKGDFSDEVFQEMLNKEDLSLEEFKERIKKRLLRERLIAQKLKEMDEKVKIEKEEIRDFYLKLRQYLKGDEKAQEEIKRFCRIYQENLKEMGENEGEVSFKRVQDKIESFLRRRKKEKLLQSWMEKLRSQAEIEIKTDGEESG